MRVTQSMLSSNLLRNLNNSYSNMNKLQQQIESGSIISRPSDDPVVALKGMSNRVEVDKVEQYQRNINQATSWLDSADEAFSQVNDITARVQELMIQAANDTNSIDERSAIATELEQLKLQLRDSANTKVGDSYIFSGTLIDQPLYPKDETANQNLTEQQLAAIDRAQKSKISVNTFGGVSMEINVSASTEFKELDKFLEDTVTMLRNDQTTGLQISDKLGELSTIKSDFLTIQATVGARQNRLDLIQNRLDIQKVNATKQLSDNEDTDYSKAITELTTAESIHQAALSVGSKVIQQTLVDFI